MTILNPRSSEPLYIVMVRQDQAEKLLRKWAKDNQCQVTIEGSRMKIFDEHSFSRFQLAWSHAWSNVTIWDCWNKRQIYYD